MKVSRRTKSIGVVLVTLLALAAAGVSQAVTKGGGTVTTSTWLHRDNCTDDPQKKVTGRATFSRKGNTVTLTVRFRHADSGDWTLYLYTGDCSNSWDLGNFTVKDGEGSKTGTADVTGYGRKFFAAPQNNGTGDYDESDIVSL